MKQIKLSRGKFALVDDDFSEEQKWSFGTNGYAFRRFIKGRETYLHRLVIGAKKGQEVDHINGNKLDNRLANLRIATSSQNAANQRKTRGSSQFKGVSYNKAMKKWEVYINKDRVRHKMGYFVSEIEASNAYFSKAKELFGEFARPV